MISIYAQLGQRFLAYCARALTANGSLPRPITVSFDAFHQNWYLHKASAIRSLASSYRPIRMAAAATPARRRLLGRSLPQYKSRGLPNGIKIRLASPRREPRASRIAKEIRRSPLACAAGSRDLRRSPLACAAGSREIRRSPLACAAGSRVLNSRSPLACAAGSRVFCLILMPFEGCPFFGSNHELVPRQLHPSK